MKPNKRTLGWFLLGIAAAACFSCGSSPSDQARKYRERAEQYVRQGKYKEASIEFQSALQKFPRDADALYGLAEAMKVEGQPGDYRATLGKVVSVAPGHAKANVELGQLAWASGHYEEALARARAARGGDPQSLDARKLEARSLSSLSRAADATAAWNRLLAASPSDESVYLDAAAFELSTGRRDLARAALQRGLQVLPRSTRLRLAQVDLLVREGDGAAAMAALQEARRAAPRDASVSIGEARYLLATGNPAGALDLLQKAQEGSRGNGQASAALAVERARVLMATGDVGRAELLLRLERNRNPADADVVAALVDVLLRQRKFDESRPLIDGLLDATPPPQVARLLETEYYLLQGRSKWALDVLESLVGAGDLTLETHLLYAKALAQEGKLAKARTEYEAVLRRSPGHAFARLDLATVLHQQREYALAQRQLEGLPKVLKDTPWVQYLYARILLEKGDLPEARRLALEFLKKAPKNPGLLTLIGDIEREGGRIKEAEARYGEAMAVAPANLDPVFAQVALLESQRRFAEARTVLDEFQRRNGEKPDVLNRLASLQAAEGDLAGACQKVDRSLILEPNYWSSRFLKGRLLLSMGQQNKAIGEFEMARRLSPARPEPVNFLAEIYKKRGEMPRAEEAYRGLLDVNPDEPLTANNLAALFLEQGRIKEAVPLARQAYAGAPNSAVVLDTLGWALDRGGNAKEALPFLEKAARALPNQPEVLLHRGLNLQACGRAGEARKVLQQVVTLAPGSPLARRAQESLRPEVTRSGEK